MTTETPELEETDSAADEARAIEPAPKPRFWDRPYVERYLVPLVLPVVVVVGLVMYVVNVSRIFLSSHGSTPVILGTLITLAILIGAALLSASPRMRTTSLTLISGGFVFTILLGGWLSLGTAEPEGEAGTTLPPEGAASGALEFVSNNNLQFVPSEAQSSTGIIQVTLNNEGGEHTLHFEDGNTLFETVGVQAAGDSASARAFFGEAGAYDFYCTIPGHREAGMEGVVTVDGETVTLEAAEAAAEAAGGGDGAGEGGAPAGDQPAEAPAETPGG
jgi:plastocyanin